MASDKNSSPDCRGWQVGQSLTQCLRHMLDTETACDVTFEIESNGEGSKSTVSAHKFMLQARSPVFEAMFNGNFNECAGNVLITDIEHDIFKDLLRYLYTDEVTLTGDNALHLLYAAKKYFLEGLKVKCEDYLEKEIAEENVCSILTHSLMYGEDTLVDRTLEYIATKAQVVSKTKGFHNMSYEALLKVLTFNGMPEGYEVDLFDGCIQWAKKKLRVSASVNPSTEEYRSVLKECVYQIRYCSIPVEEFAKRFGETNILTPEEKNHIVFCIITKEQKYNLKLCQMGFNMTKRPSKCTFCADHILQSCQVTPSAGNHVFVLTPDKTIELFGFSVITGDTPNLKHTVKIVLSDGSTGTNIGTIDCVVSSNDSGRAIPVYFKERVLVPANTSCKIEVSLQGPNFSSSKYNSILSYVSVSDVNFNFTLISTPLNSYGYQKNFVSEVWFNKA